VGDKAIWLPRLDAAMSELLRITGSETFFCQPVLLSYNEHLLSHYFDILKKNLKNNVISMI